MRIVIIGGGTAGWLAALMCSKIAKEHDVTILDSSSIGIIGAGESSTGQLRGIISNELWDFGCDEADFFRHTNATPKYAILHRNWNGDNTEYIAPVDSFIDDSYSGTNCLLSAYISKKNPMHHASINGRLVDSKLTSFYLQDNKIKSINRHAYNFDARLAAKYLEKVCGDNVEKLDNVVKDIEFDDQGNIKFLILDNGKKIAGDFIIDASGFSKLLSSKMQIKWIEYKELTLNTAMPFIMPYDQARDHKFLATSWAQKYGWMWMVPKYNEIGCGYVFDDRFINPTQAQDEIEKVLRKKIDPIKIIKFTPGKLETVWNKNVLSIGLCASFLEPLEATSIHSTILQLNSFIFSHLKENKQRTLNEAGRIIYNRNMSKMFDSLKDFIVLHYLTKRNDTEFWIQSRKFAEDNKTVGLILEIVKNRLINLSDIDSGVGYAHAELYNWILCGLGHYDSDTARKEISILDRLSIARKQENELSEYMSQFQWLRNQEFMSLIHRS